MSISHLHPTQPRPKNPQEPCANVGSNAWLPHDWESRPQFYKVSLHNHPIGTWCRFNGIPVDSDHEVHGSSWDFQIFVALMSPWILWNPITSWYTIIIETFRVTTSSTSKHRKSIGNCAFHVLVSAGFLRCLVTFAGPGGWKVVPSCSK